jgi:hypothetical protein
MRSNVLWCLFAISAVASTAVASDATLNWDFQPTGFQAGYFGQTALAMGDGQTWPVVFSIDNNSSVQAYSLYPVTNPQTRTNWQQIGTNLLVTSGTVLSAASSSDGRVAVVAPNGYDGAAVVGDRNNGFGSVLPGVLAVDFDSHGNLVRGTMNTIPPLSNPSPTPLVDIATSPFGFLGAVDSRTDYYQRSSLFGWQGVSLPQAASGPNLISPDLAIDSLGRPHVVGQIASSAATGVGAYDFNVSQGQWQWHALAANAVSLASIAADSKGGVGAAWVQNNGNNGLSLMYAYDDGVHDWVTQTVVGGIYNPLDYCYDAVDTQQKVGLAFDANDFPVISFTAGPQNIWLAYDPKVAAIPEPSALVLLGTAAVAFVGCRRYRRRAR